jgi:glycine C-acetyltransferase
MLKGKFSYTPPAALTGSLRDYRRARGADLTTRIEGFAKWRGLRRQHGLWPSDAPQATDAEASGERLDFAREDALGLATHAAVLAAAAEAMIRFGLAGAQAPAASLERRVAGFLAAPEACLFPTGWAAGYAAVKALARATDHVILDAAAPAGLREGAAAATRNICLFRHNRLDECRSWLEKIRSRDAENGVVVAVETLSATEADMADLKALQALCHEFNAVLVVYAGCDFGAMGADGLGALGDQGVLGKLDVVAGGLAGAFAVEGGFVACRSPEMTDYVRGFGAALAHAAPLAPAACAAALAAFDIVEDAEGEALRATLAGHVATLRSRLADAGLELIGAPAPAICVALGAEGLARLVARQLAEAGLEAELVEFPAAPKDQARLRLRVSARHSADEIRAAGDAVAAACQAGREEFDWLNSEREKLRAQA